jgi:hypothetical protein
MNSVITEKAKPVLVTNWPKVPQRMIVGRHSVMSACQAVGPMSCGKHQHARAIDRDQLVALQQPRGVQYLAPD